MSSREEVLQLIKQRDLLETEIAELRDALNSHRVTAGESLVTEDGYPRADIDVYAVTHLRAKLVRKQNDVKQLLQTISEKLPTAFAPKQTGESPLPTKKVTKTPPSNRSSDSSGSASENLVDSPSSLAYSGPPPFAVVNAVVSGTLGSAAGLAANDQILKFGNATSLSHLSAEMQRHSNQDLEILVRRNNAVHQVVVHLVPGRSLGAHIVPLAAST